MPLFDEDGGGGLRINMMAVGPERYKGCFQELPEEVQERDQVPRVGKAMLASGGGAREEIDSNGRCAINASEEWSSWEMRLVLGDDVGGTVELQKPGCDSVWQMKAEVGYTENVEQLLSSLEVPLSIVHTVDPREAAQHFQEWLPALSKELRSLEHAIEKVQANDDDVRGDLESGKGQMIPMKVVFTIKPPDPSSEDDSTRSFYKRKARVVVCGNMASHQPGEVYTNTAPAEVVRAAIALACVFGWDLGMIDIVAAFLQTPLKELKGAPLVYGIPPKALVRSGLCGPRELWRFTHAIYGLQESPKLWGSYRDIRLSQLQFAIDGKQVKLVQGKVEPSWWSIVKEDVGLIGILVVYVDDLLLCSTPQVIKGLSAAIQTIWRTSDLQLVTEGAIRFLGMDISIAQRGFALSQRSYIEELVRLHSIPPNRKDLIPISKDWATFNVEEQEGEYTDAELKSAQQCAGELLWLAQRTRPDISYVASLVGSLATRAPRRAVQIAEKTIAFLQRTVSYALIYQGDQTGLAAYCDASFAPEGARSHSGWLVFLHDCAISWKSGRQSSITLSTAEAELTAMSEAVLALQSTEAMIKDIIPEGQPLQLFSDSTSALAIANGSGSWRTRHLRLRSAWVSELIQNQAISVHHCAGEFQPADLLTKALASQRMIALSRLLNLVDTEEVEKQLSQEASNIRRSIASAPTKVPKG